MIRSFTSVFHLILVHNINVTDIEMANQLLGLNKLNLSPSKNWKLKVVNGSSLFETHLIHLSPTGQLFNSTWVQTKFCPKWALVRRPAEPWWTWIFFSFPSIGTSSLLSELSSSRLDINPAHWTAPETINITLSSDSSPPLQHINVRKQIFCNRFLTNGKNNVREWNNQFSYLKNGETTEAGVILWCFGLRRSCHCIAEGFKLVVMPVYQRHASDFYCLGDNHMMATILSFLSFWLLTPSNLFGHLSSSTLLPQWGEKRQKWESH